MEMKAANINPVVSGAGGLSQRALYSSRDNLAMTPAQSAGRSGIGGGRSAATGDGAPADGYGRSRAFPWDQSADVVADDPGEEG